MYDKNGNLVYVNTGRMMNDGHNEVGTRERKLIWDEENRLFSVDDNGFVSNYWYDAYGEGFCCNDGSMEAAMAQARKAQARAVARSFKDPDNYEN